MGFLDRISRKGKTIYFKAKKENQERQTTKIEKRINEPVGCKTYVVLTFPRHKILNAMQGKTSKHPCKAPKG
jgi:hypothetical protein